jgi:hypothetical protein
MVRFIVLSLEKHYEKESQGIFAKKRVWSAGMANSRSGPVWIHYVAAEKMARSLASTLA